ncbi:hypothetical protein BCR43DRAFT_488101 [Syncephalastrum racemosum]|uniref:Uncharacterized protein n=1 Tax=Syncephalastrum racemosum TaxID=13706 RepID=A0A1X2HI57_SYNRA|nr:hypothetical protein BCR43DRAFT_488101 [Syncephalastrum racemosum]
MDHSYGNGQHFSQAPNRYVTLLLFFLSSTLVSRPIPPFSSCIRVVLLEPCQLCLQVAVWCDRCATSSPPFC